MTQDLWEQAQADFPIEQAMAREYGACFCKCGCRAPEAGGTLCHKCRTSRSLMHGPATAASIYNDLADKAEAATPAPRQNVERPVAAAREPVQRRRRTVRQDGMLRMVTFTDMAAGDYAATGRDGTLFSIHVSKLGGFPLALVTVRGPGAAPFIRGHLPTLARTLMEDPAGARWLYQQVTEMA